MSEELLMFMNEPLHNVSKAQCKALQYAIQIILIDSSVADFLVKSLCSSASHL